MVRDVGRRVTRRFASGVFVLSALASAAPLASAGDDPRAARFAAAAARVLARKELDGSTVGIELRSLTRDARVWSRNANHAFAPASNMKLVTLYLSLAILGPDWNFETPLIAGGPIVAGGRLEGDLWIRGGGDPTLEPCFFESEEENAPLQPFVQALTLQGIRHVRGDLVVDDRVFDRQFIPEGWPQNQLSEEYAAPVAALSLNGNCLHVRVTSHAGSAPGAELRPPVFGWRLLSELTPSNGSQFAVGILPPDTQGCVRVRGSVGAEVGVATAKLPVADPPLFFANALRAALERGGITVGGAVRRANDGEQPDPKGKTLFTRRSPLIPALQRCGKESDNTIAEHLLKSCAALRFGQGTSERGAELVQKLANELGIAPGQVVTVDGSGLSHVDQVTPAFLAAVLAKAYAAPWRDEFVRCLPISGVDGTLEKRMTEAAMQYRVRAKTGFIKEVSALSGYALSGEPGDQEVFAFSFVINGFKGANAEMKKVQDDLCRAIVALPRAAGE
jgi:D-alanyl-D-alanine carboxypeptidase/D-alanyl-D-alanine-endopeptidase (penicillin-binding protein 4)